MQINDVTGDKFSRPKSCLIYHSGEVEGWKVEGWAAAPIRGRTGAANPFWHPRGRPEKSALPPFQHGMKNGRIKAFREVLHNMFVAYCGFVRSCVCQELYTKWSPDMAFSFYKRPHFRDWNNGLPALCTETYGRGWEREKKNEIKVKIKVVESAK